MIKGNTRSFTKVSLLKSATEIQKLEKFSTDLGVNLFIKRDDLNGIGFGGNKVRKLEYLLGEAQDLGATHILTLGAIQSNHARLTAVTARMMGFEVELFLKESVAIDTECYQQNGNIALNNILEVQMHRIPNDNKMISRVESRMEEIRKEGGIPYFIPVGGSNALGNLGYLDCYNEIMIQEKELGVDFDYIVAASGSGGTHGGLIIGNILNNNQAIIKAYNVQPEHDELVDHTIAICNETLSWFGKESADISIVDLNSNYSGKSYGFPEEIHLVILKKMAKREGVFLDPVYTSKAFTGLVEDVKKGIYPPGSSILFVHTGGSPGIFAYANWY